MEYISNEQIRENKVNQFVSHRGGKSYPSHTIVHAKLEMTEPGDADELEADAVASEVINGGVIRREISQGGVSGGITMPANMEGVLSSMQGGGMAMPSGLKNMMENGFNRDFSQVRLHTGADATQASSSINAKAFTYGNDIYFNQGQFNPHTSEGQRLVAHELTHVVQGSGKVGREMPDDKFVGEFLYSSYVDDPTYVLSQNNQELMKERYRLSKNRKPLTIVLYTSQRAGEEAFITDTGINDLVSKDNQTKVLIIQGKTSISDYEVAIKSMIALYGPLQNIILMGHGNHNIMILDNNVTIDTNSDDFFNMIKEEFEQADIETSKKLTHSILFSECLTGANKHSPYGLVNYVSCIMGDNVLVRGNKAETVDAQNYDYMDLEKQICSEDAPLTFEDNIQPSSPINGICYSPIVKPQDQTYVDYNMAGILHEIKNHLELNDQNINLNYNNVDNYKCDGVVLNGASILNEISLHIKTNPKSTLSFINYLLFDPSFVCNLSSINDMFNYADNYPYDYDIIYNKR